ncbi:MAG: aspartate kinase [Patescibacteria group bacterium]
MKVMKFGGTSLGNSQRIQHVAEIIVSYTPHEQVVVVASAMAGITDNLIGLIRSYEQQAPSAKADLLTLGANHIQTLRDIVSDENRYQEALVDLNHLLDKLAIHLTEISGKVTAKQHAAIACFGERLSSLLLHMAIIEKGLDSKVVPGTMVIGTDDDYLNARADLPRSEQMCEFALKPLLTSGIVPVVTGFFGQSNQGQLTLLGRGGSDYTAAILAAAMNAEELIVWKEVNGVYTADPLKDITAKFLPEISYETAAEMARNGAKVLHPETMEPVRNKHIPIRVKNTFHPTLTGTRIYG